MISHSKPEPLVSIITINYNSAIETAEFLDSLTSIDYKNYEVFVVDNDSQQRDIEQVARQYPDVNFIFNRKNLGFAGGNNTALEKAQGDFIFFVNNDAVLTPSSIKELVKTFKQYKNVGAVSPKFHYFDRPGIIEYAGYSSINNLTGRNTTIGANEKDEGQYDVPSLTHYTHGGGMMVSREIIEIVGLMPEDYFLYYEEFDWCEKIKSHGFKIYYQPNALVRHKVSASIGKSSTLKTYYLTRNRILFMRRNKPTLHFIIFMVFLLMISIPKFVLVNIIKGKVRHIRYFLLAVIWNLGVKIQPQF